MGIRSVDEVKYTVRVLFRKIKMYIFGDGWMISFNMKDSEQFVKRIGAAVRVARKQGRLVFLA